jgi:hypothetical protein
VDEELERTWKDAVMAYFKILSKHLPGGTDDKYESPVKMSASRLKLNCSLLNMKQEC